MTRRGRPRDTPAQRILRQRQRKARRRDLQETAQYLHDAAILFAGEPRRSLRIRRRTDNACLLAQGIEPFYTYILFGERVTGPLGYPSPEAPSPPDTSPPE